MEDLLLLQAKICCIEDVVITHERVLVNGGTFQFNEKVLIDLRRLENPSHGWNRRASELERSDLCCGMVSREWGAKNIHDMQEAKAGTD